MSDNLSALFARLERLCAVCFQREPKEPDPVALLREANGLLEVVSVLLAEGEDELARTAIFEQRNRFIERRMGITVTYAPPVPVLKTKNQ